jgi:hypothetical protein
MFSFFLLVFFFSQSYFASCLYNCVFVIPYYHEIKCKTSMLLFNINMHKPKYIKILYIIWFCIYISPSPQ